MVKTGKGRYGGMLVSLHNRVYNRERGGVRWVNLALKCSRKPLKGF